MILLVVAGLGVTSVVTYRSIDGFLLGRVDQELTTGYDFVLHACVDPRFAGAGFGTSPVPPGTYGLVTDPSGTVLAGPVYLFSYGSSNPPAPSVSTSSPRSKPFTARSTDGSSLRYRVLVQDVSVPT